MRPSAPEESLPRYNLPVGRKLVYSSADQSKPVKEPGIEINTTERWQLTVVAENPDGSRRVIVRSATSRIQKSRGIEHKSPERVELAYADVFPDGRIRPNPSSGMQMSPSRMLPPLPKDATELTEGWRQVDDERGRIDHFTVAGKPTASSFAFTCVHDGIIARIYQATWKKTYHFDPARGAIISIVGERTQEYGFHNKAASTTRIEEDEMIPADEAKQLAADFERFFVAREKYQALLDEVKNSPANADATLAGARALIEKARDEVKSEDAKNELANVLKTHGKYAKYARESAEQFKDVLDKPSPDWSTTDIDGKPVKLADFKGKVVVMDFWYRGCVWCVYAMPQVKQLAADYKDKAVAVLGMNTDRAEEDARFVINVFDLQYPTIKAEGIPEKYAIRGFPTLVILDQDGVVRGVHIGHSPTLRENVSRRIDELLKAPPNAAS